MFARILVPLDGAAEGRTREEHVLEAARRLAEREGARLMLLHVDGDATSAQVAVHERMIARSAELSRDGAYASARFESGVADDGIVRAALQEHADLIVISPRQRPLLQTFLRPGVTSELVRHTPAPVLVWPEYLPGAQLDVALDTSVAPVIVPLDGSAEAERALPLAETVAREWRRTLLLVTVATPLPLTGLDVSYTGTTYPIEVETTEDRLQESLRYLQRVRKNILKRTGMQAQTMGCVGKVALVLADVAASHPGSLIVMTTHGRGRAQQLMLGSVAARLLRLTPAPLLIVPPARAAAQDQTDAERVVRDGAEPVGGALDAAPTFESR